MLMRIYVCCVHAGAIGGQGGHWTPWELNMGLLQVQ